MNHTTHIDHTDPALPAPPATDITAALNASCYCIGLDQAALKAAMRSDPTAVDVFQLIEERCPHLFSSRPVFVGQAHIERMARLVATVEAVLATPAVRAAILGSEAESGATLRNVQHTRSVFLGYDFHLRGEEIGLIEINTNAGGAMLNALLARAQRACCAEVEQMLPGTDLSLQFEQAIVAMFRQEWQMAGRSAPLRTIAIVDQQPESQYLYPEFLLFQRLFEQAGLQAFITDPASLQVRDGQLMLGEVVIDLVYNRLTDFALADPSSQALHTAWTDDLAVVTPHPFAHALYANKRNLALLTDPTRLAALGVAPAQVAILLDGIPHTEVVQAAHAERLWSQRRQLFFKPASGYGSRAAYRGDKITTRVWKDILAGDYVAQKLVAPGARSIGEDSGQQLKFDVRSYVYDGQSQWLAARLYQGQTTNFRTPGGGFAPVYRVPSLSAGCGCAN